MKPAHKTPEHGMVANETADSVDRASQARQVIWESAGLGSRGLAGARTARGISDDWVHRAQSKMDIPPYQDSIQLSSFVTPPVAPETPPAQPRPEQR